MLTIRSWERATENECERAISTFEEDFLTECKNYSPSVNAVLKHLKYEEVGFDFYKASGSVAGTPLTTGKSRSA